MTDKNTSSNDGVSVRRAIEVVTLVLIIFLSAYLLFGIGTDNFGAYTVLPSLCAAYIFVYYWQKRIDSRKKQSKTIEIKKKVK